MNRTHPSWLRVGIAAICAVLSSGWLASGLSIGQTVPQQPMAPRPPAVVPPGVVSEQADENAIRGNVRVAAVPRNAPAASAAVPGTNIAPVAITQTQTQTTPVAAPNPTVVAATKTTVTGNVAVDPAAAAGTASIALTADNTRAADLGIWLRATPQGTLTIADLATTGPIAGLGLMPGDTIVSLNGQPITNERQFLHLLLADNVRNQPLSLLVNRSGANQMLSVTPANLLQGIVQADPLFQAGVVLDASNPSQLIVQRVFPRTPAYYAGLRTGDVITSVGGQRVGIPADLQRLWTANNVGLPVQVTRAGQSRGLLFTGSGMFGSQTVAPTGTTFGNQAGTTRTIGAAANANPLNAAPTANTTTAADAASATALPATATPSLIPAAGSTQRVPVTIPGATNPPAGNPLYRNASPPGTPPSAAPAGGAVPAGGTVPAAGGTAPAAGGTVAPTAAPGGAAGAAAGAGPG